MKEVQQIEAIKYALRQSKDGVIVSFVIHPNDIQPEMMALPIGSRVMFGWYEIRDDEKPKGGDAPVPAHTGRSDGPSNAQPHAEQSATHGAHPKHERSLAERCAILCQDVRFRNWLSECWGMAIYDAASADTEIKRRLRIDSKAELNEGAANFNAQAAANFKLLLMTYDAHRADKDYADVRR